MSRAIWRDGLALAGLILLLAAVWWFAAHAVTRGVQAFSGDIVAQGRLASTTLGNLAIYSHMVFGGVITCLALFQWAGPIRRWWPSLHRLSGRLLALLAFLTGVGGLTYIVLNGTIGGPEMSAGFALYGVLMVIAAVQTPRMAMTRQYARHRRWAVRLIVLCLASWLYRVHYGVLYATICAEGTDVCIFYSTPEFSGPFDRIQNWAFYFPYLLLAEVWLRLRSYTPRPVNAL